MTKFNPGDKAYIIESTIFVEKVAVVKFAGRMYRCLFRLVPSEPPTDETGCSSSQGDWLPTPKASDDSTGIGKNEEPYLDGQIWRRPNGVSMRLSAMANRDMLPTPRANVVNGCDLNNPKLAERHKSNLEEEVAKAVVNGLLPTPTAIEGVKWTNTWNPNSQMGQSLSAMAGSGMLPTPKDLLPTPVVMEDRRKIYGEKAEDEHRTEKMMSNLNPYSIEQGMGLENGAITAAKDGKTSRLSPLFTEEMMGFPLMWTALPFLSESGAPKPSKPTATR